jgi:hypothetical protein
MARSGPQLSPVVEFFPILDSKGQDLFLDPLRRPDLKELRSALQQARGIYAFYNSEAEIIYIGKTEKQSLWTRMRNSYKQEKARYERYYVRHPDYKYAVPKNGKVRRISRKQFGLSNVANFVSAYSISTRMIGFCEQLLIRLLPNDLINVRMEGNVSLEPFQTSHISRKKRR